MRTRRRPRRDELDLAERDAPPATLAARAHRGAALCRAVLAGQPLDTEKPGERLTGSLTSEGPQRTASDELHACPRCYRPITGTCDRCPPKD